MKATELYQDKPEQFAAWLKENGLTDPVTGKKADEATSYSSIEYAVSLRNLVTVVNDLETKLAKLRPELERIKSAISCVECGDLKSLNTDTCDWCTKTI